MHNTSASNAYLALNGQVHYMYIINIIERENLYLSLQVLLWATLVAVNDFNDISKTDK